MEGRTDLVLIWANPDTDVIIASWTAVSAVFVSPAVDWTAPVAVETVPVAVTAPIAVSVLLSAPTASPTPAVAAPAIPVDTVSDPAMPLTAPSASITPAALLVPWLRVL